MPLIIMYYHTVVTKLSRNSGQPVALAWRHLDTVIQDMPSLMLGLCARGCLLIDEYLSFQVYIFNINSSLSCFCGITWCNLALLVTCLCWISGWSQEMEQIPAMPSSKKVYTKYNQSHFWCYCDLNHVFMFQD